MRWPMREALLSLREILRERALRDFRHNEMLYVQGGLKREPERPPILKD